MRTVVSDDGRVARFFLLFKGGQNSAFALSFSKIGLLLNAIRSTLAVMSNRLGLHQQAAVAEMGEGLAEALPVKAVATGMNESGEKLLWIETSDNGSFSFRLSEEARLMLADAVQKDGSTARRSRRLGSRPS